MKILFFSATFFLSFISFIFFFLNFFLRIETDLTSLQEISALILSTLFIFASLSELKIINN